MKLNRALVGILFLNFLCFLVLALKFPFYSSASLAQIKSWHTNFGGAIFFYTHYIIYLQYFLSGIIVLYFLYKRINFKQIGLYIKHHITLLLLVTLLFFSTITAFFNSKKVYPFVRFPSFSSFVNSNSTPIIKPIVYNSKHEKIDLRRALKPYEIHQYNYVIINLMFEERRKDTKSFLEEFILNDKTNLKFDTLIYKVPE